MMIKKTLKTYFSVPLFLFLTGSVISPTEGHAKEIQIKILSNQDSVGNEVVNGNRFLIHKLSPQETYYQLGRIYNVPVKDIMEANNKKNLRVGDRVRIPRGKATPNAPVIAKKAENKPTINNSSNQFTEYKVGKSETLYAISRRFSISVEEIKKSNNLTSNNVREGQLLRIPNEEPPAPQEVIQPPVPIIVEERQPIDDSDFRSNKYGIREKKEKGVGVWMDNFGDGQSSFALHKSAPIGTILKITNPMNKSVTFAKVVGKFSDNEDTQNAIVVISKSVATSIGVLDRRFQIELNYGAPLEQE